MLATQSSYVLTDPDRRDRLLHAPGELIDARLDGRITKKYLAVLAIATKTP